MSEYEQSRNIVDEVAEQIGGLTERYNKLANFSENIRAETTSMNSEISHLQNDIYEEIKIIRQKLTDLNSSIGFTKSEMKNLSGDFKSIIKKDNFEKLNRRIDKLNYEMLISRKELEEELDL